MHGCLLAVAFKSHLFSKKTSSVCNFPLLHAYHYKLHGLDSTFNLDLDQLMTEREYNQCVTDYADNVYRFILKNLRHEEDAKDVVQTAFEKMWRNRNEVEYEKSKSYLFTIAYHQMIDHIRKVKRIQLKEEFKEEVRIHDKPMHNVKKILEEALARLNETQRSLVMLKDYEGYSYEEIGQITGLSSSQVKVYLHRARIQLKNFLVRPENVM